MTPMMSSARAAVTKRRDIKRLFLEGADQAAISQRTGALTGCAGCEWGYLGNICMSLQRK